MALPQGGRRKVTSPAPFQRPSIEVSQPLIKRAWQQVTVDRLSKGDNVAGHGILNRVEQVGESGRFVLVNVLGQKSAPHRPDHVYMAFTATDD